MAIFNGTDLGVYSDQVLIAAATDVTLTLNAETIDITTKDSSAFRELLPGLRSGSISVSGLIDYVDASNRDFIDLYTAWETRAVLALKFSRSSLATGEASFSANAFITSLEQSGGTEDTATYSATFELTGTIDETVAS
jgi:TP901-1 family phage major tail protein